MALKDRGFRRRGVRIVCSFVVGFAGLLASAQTDQTPAVSVSTADIVRQLVDHNQDRANRLKYYTSQRHYHVEYKGFPHSADATMDVEAIYSAPSKTFRVLSEAGSQKLINHVLKKLLKGEQDAAQEQSKNALTPANYKFALLETATENGRNLFVLRVEPNASGKFLYRGKIWVDGEDFAVVRVEAEPAEKLSFWIRNTEIKHIYAKVGQFWLPRRDTSVTKVLLGGIATLTIDFEKYELQSSATQNHVIREAGN